MATDDDDKPAGKSASSGDAPKKKKKKRPADAASAGSTAKKKKAAADTSARTRPPEPAADAQAEDEESADLVVRGGESTALDAGAADAPVAGAEAAREGDEAEEEAAATHLGIAKYVLAGFFAAGIVGGYVLGRIVHGTWASLSNRDFFAQALPQLAAVPDDTKSTIGTAIGGLVALLVVIRTYKRPDVRAWTDEVAAELTKVKWPTKKDVTNSTMVVIAASTVATIYLALLDRLWAFVTNLVYGTGT